uniref:Uncharacterized protein n=1 Tax=Kryptolebias marmoratus TaxID=37003 RepID=A0A3Q2ZKK5_KRYMA
ELCLSLHFSLPFTSSGDSVEWPDPFPIPQFSHDVELQLKEANCRYAKDGSLTISAYPERQHYENGAKALVEKHPCLREPGSEKGWYSWFHSLKFKLGNYQQKLSAAGCPEVVVNKRKAGGSKGKCVKKSKKGEVNYCPDPPEGSENMEKRKIMESAIGSDEEIVGDQPHTTKLISRWPVLFHEKQVITQLGINSTERFSPVMLRLWTKQSLKDILDCLVKDVSGTAHVDTLDDALKGIQLGLLIACEGGERSAIPHEVFDVAVVVEETIVLHNIKDVAQCFAMLMGVIYCVNLKYPDDMTYSFKFLQNKILRYKL